MSSRLNPYLSFNGDAREAMGFYAEVFGGTPTLSTFGEFGTQDPANADRIMHGMLETEAGYTIMLADVMTTMEFTPPAGITMSISGDDGDLLRGYYEKLADGGTVTMPMEKQAWGDEFGMCVDRFGVPWMIDVTQQA